MNGPDVVQFAGWNDERLSERISTHQILQICRARFAKTRLIGGEGIQNLLDMKWFTSSAFKHYDEILRARQNSIRLLQEFGPSEKGPRITRIFTNKMKSENKRLKLRDTARS